MKRNRVYLMAFVCALTATAAATAITSRVRVLATTEKGPEAASSFQAGNRSRSPNRILTPRLSPQLRVPFTALGNRLVKSGMERLTFLGTLTRGGSSQPVVVIHEFPGLVRVTGNQGPLVSYNARVPGNDQNVGPGVRVVVESLLYDSVEHFFIAQWRGAATRFLGARTSATESAGAAGPFYDVYEVSNENAADWPGQARVKRYFFNSDTQLLEIVRYEVERNGETISVETRFGGWHSVQGQQAPSSVARLENDHLVFSFTFTATTLTPRNVVDAGNPSTSSTD
jgi:hypothetical protein